MEYIVSFFNYVFGEIISIGDVPSGLLAAAAAFPFKGIFYGLGIVICVRRAIFHIQVIADKKKMLAAIDAEIEIEKEVERRMEAEEKLRIDFGDRYKNEGITAFDNKEQESRKEEKKISAIAHQENFILADKKLIQPVKANAA